MASPFLGEIRNFSFTVIPKNWLPCNGQLLSIQQNQALFSLLGTAYGGNGSTTFGLPNLQGRVPLDSTNGTTVGTSSGEAAHTLATTEMPVHIHTATGSTVAVSTGTPGTGVLPGLFGSNNYTTTNTSLSPMSGNTVSGAGGNQPHNNVQPTTVTSLCIAIQGIFPSRN